MRGLCLAWALALALGASPSAERLVRVEVLGKERAPSVRLQGARDLTAWASGETLLVDGTAVDEPLLLPAASWSIETGKVLRRYEGAVSIEARDGVIAVAVEMPLERYVAEVVAAETDPGTPAAALEAQAIVSRSYALAAGARHPSGALCDLAHCQVTRGEGAGAHARAAREAAKRTEGQVLLLPDGSVAAAVFHAACGGRTAEASAIFGAIPGADGTDRSGSRAVADGCAIRRWEATLQRADVDAALARLLGSQAKVQALAIERGAGGVVTRVRDRRSGRWTSGDGFARALDRDAGWGVIRSPKFELSIVGELVRVRGNGIGHGVGLCQAGARRLAAQGLDAAAILRRYFSGAKVGALPRR